jgi:hypothetical protein
MEPAKLNPQFISEPEVHLEDLKAGESGCVIWNDMAIDPEYRCYIDPKAKVYRNTYLGKIHVTRTEEGFEVRILTDSHHPMRWRLGAYNPQADEGYARYLPVVKIEYEESEWEKNRRSIERDLARAQEYNRESAELQKEIEKKLKKLRNKEDESSGG